MLAASAGLLANDTVATAPDTITVTANNGSADSNLATVTINVTGSAPTITTASTVIFTVGRTNTFTGVVPEPSTFGLVGALLVLGAWARWGRRAA